MSDWGNPWNWMGAFVLVVGWLFYDAMRPVKDYYVLQRRYFERLYEEPWRGKQLAAHYHGFDDYLAAKAVFERHEENYINVLDDGGQEAEHTLFMTTARTKSAALNRLKTSNAYSKELLLQTYLPTHSCLQAFDVLLWRARGVRECGIAGVQMGQIGNLVSAQGTANAGMLRPAVHAGFEEGAVDDQLMPAREQVEQARFAVGPLEFVGLLDGHPWHPPAFSGQRVAGPHHGLFLREHLPARSLPKADSRGPLCSRQCGHSAQRGQDLLRT
jgi:hypothetical protein